MKSFKESLKETVDKIKSEDEQNFVDKHVVDKKDHPVAKEDQFTSNAKKAKRKADHEDDAAVYEEARQIECPDCGESYAKGEDHECENMGESCAKKSKKHMSEEEMTKAQYAKREEIVKSMKKKMSSFKDKYGDKADEVMYATATKMAMKEAFDPKKVNLDAIHIVLGPTTNSKDGIKALMKAFKTDEKGAKALLKRAMYESVEANSASEDIAEAVEALFDSLNESNQFAMVQRMTADADGFDQIVEFAKEAM